jgi:hypothetical protein
MKTLPTSPPLKPNKIKTLPLTQNPKSKHNSNRMKTLRIFRRGEGQTGMQFLYSQTNAAPRLVPPISTCDNPHKPEIHGADPSPSRRFRRSRHSEHHSCDSPDIRGRSRRRTDRPPPRLRTPPSRCPMPSHRCPTRPEPLGPRNRHTSPLAPDLRVAWPRRKTTESRLKTACHQGLLRRQRARKDRSRNLRKHLRLQSRRLRRSH